MKKVLVVDKDGLATEPIIGVASDLGVGVELCEETGEALNLLRSGKYSLVIVDIDNAGQNPIDVLGAFRGASPMTNIITFTASNHLDLEKKVRLEGVFYYMVGPAGEAEMREALEILL